MTVVIDTNVFLDIFLDRQYARSGLRVVQSVETGRSRGLVTLPIVQNVYYYVESTHSRSRAHDVIGRLLGTFALISMSPAAVERAWERSDPSQADRDDYCPDFEDAVIQEAARAAEADRICTINLEDFETSPVEAVHPIKLARYLHEQEGG